MPAEIRFVEAAKREYLKVCRWYESHANESVASAFVDELDHVLSRITDDLTAGTEFRIRYRWIRLRKFPYLVYFRYINKDCALVLAVAHKRRRPGYWLRRDQT